MNGTTHLVRQTFIAAGMAFLLICSAHAPAVYAEDLARHFAKHGGPRGKIVDHSAWDEILKRYVKPDRRGVNRVDYARLKREAAGELAAYLGALQKVDVRQLSRREQFAFWVNLYNAATVQTVLKHYPVASIRDIDISPGFFADGPWGAKILTVNGIKLSLDDIEHGILRKNWHDPRIHYAVNCASVGCPNLARDSYTGAKLDEQLDRAARDYVNNPRGVRFEGSRLIVSKIFKWYKEDFGSSEQNVLKHLIQYANPQLANLLRATKSIAAYEYDWQLNDFKR